MLTVKLPKRLEKVLLVRTGTPVPTRLRIRVMSARFGKRYTSRAKSPIVGPEKPPAPPKPPVSDPNADCDLDGVANKADADDDNDLLSDTYEAGLSKLLDRCKGDTDGDGVEDGYEYQSARDLNDDEYQNANGYTPYPRKLPFPNPLDGEDAQSDHDGDALTLLEEFKLWNYTAPRAVRARSSGCPTRPASSTPPACVPAAPATVSRRWPPRTTRSSGSSWTGLRAMATRR